MTFKVRIRAKPFYTSEGLHVRLYSAMLKRIETPTYKGWRVVPFERQLAWFGRGGIPMIPVGIGYSYDQRLCLAPITLMATHVMEACPRCKNGFSDDSNAFDYLSQVNQWVEGALSIWNRFCPKQAKLKATTAHTAMGVLVGSKLKENFVVKSVYAPSLISLDSIEKR